MEYKLKMKFFEHCLVSYLQLW